MKDTNEVMITGQLLRDPVMRTTRSGEPMCSFQLSVARPDPSKAHDFLDVVVWKPLSEQISMNLQTGIRLRVKGSLRKSMYTGNDGHTHASTQIVAQEIEEIEESGQENLDPDLIRGIAMENAA